MDASNSKLEIEEKKLSLSESHKLDAPIENYELLRGEEKQLAQI